MKLPVAPTPLLAVLLAACSSSVQEVGSTTSSSSTTSTSTSSTSTSSTSTSSSTGSTSSTSGTGTTTTTSPAPCGEPGCGAGQLCVVPVCQSVLGEICVFGALDAGASCPPGTKHTGQFDTDCGQPGFACVDGCPAAAPFCLDVPAGCGGALACDCLGADPCAAVSGGLCHDASITAGVLACSL
jgi:hypothetical protein